MIDVAALLAALPARISDIAFLGAARTPQAPALRDGALRWSYAQLAQAVRAGAELLREHGVRGGDRVVLVGENCAAQVALIFAAAAVDAWIVCLNARLSAPELDAIVAHCEPRRLLYLGANSPEAAAHGARHGAAALDTALGPLMLGALNPGCAPEAAAAGAAPVAALIYTSGTTGQPKGVMLTHCNLLFIAAVSSTLRGLTPDDRAYGVLPISHVYGLASVMLGTLYAGACLHLAPRFDPAALLAALRDDDLAILQGVPAMYARLLASVAGAAAPPVHGLRFAYAGGSPLAPSLKVAVEKLLGLPLHNGYGMTESAPTISQTRLDAPRADASVGLAIPGVEVRLVDAGGADVANGADGELWVRGPNLMAGYYRAPDLTAATMRPGGWLNTGDVARREADGALFIVGRVKELIIRSGFKVYPLEVETALNAHPAVTQSAVVGRTLADGNEEIIAYVEVDTSHAIKVDVLHAHLARTLAPYKCPAHIIVMASLPAAATGKILKGRLRQMAQDEGHDNFGVGSRIVV